MDPVTVFIAIVFLIAGAVKGAVGLGLPPIAMGLLAVVMLPVEAAALLVLPSFLTNAWQMLYGPHLFRLVRRFWPLLICAVIGTLLGADWLSEENARVGTLILGVVLAVYAFTGLVSVRYLVSAARQTWLGPIAGLTTGLATAATGVSSVPVVPYFQAAGLEKDELVQAMGLSFTVSTVALAFNLAAAGAFSPLMGPRLVVAVGAVFVGVYLGQIVRRRLDAAVFRTWFFLALMVLGLYLSGRSLL